MDGLNLYDRKHSYRYVIIFVFFTSFKGTTLDLNLNTYSNYISFPLMGLSRITKQIIPMEHNKVKNPNW